MNKRHWVSVFLNGSVPEDFTERLVGKSYDLTFKKRKVSKK
jgi:predicted DNA-binding protein (MmcQ/YjbR family)